MPDISSIAGSVSSFFLENPGLRLTQGTVVLLAAVDLYLLFFTLRDVLLRTRSLLAQFFAVLLVAALPIVGFFLYLLLRPARTVQQRALEELLEAVLAHRMREEAVGVKDEQAPPEESDSESPHALSDIPPPSASA